jgi:hypothetical protein
MTGCDAGMRSCWLGLSPPAIAVSYWPGRRHIGRPSCRTSSLSTNNQAGQLPRCSLNLTGCKYAIALLSGCRDTPSHCSLNVMACANAPSRCSLNVMACAGTPSTTFCADRTQDGWHAFAHHPATSCRPRGRGTAYPTWPQVVLRNDADPHACRLSRPRRDALRPSFNDTCSTEERFCAWPPPSVKPISPSSSHKPA